MTKNDKERQRTTKNNEERQRTTKNDKERPRTTKNDEEQQRPMKVKKNNKTIGRQPGDKNILKIGKSYTIPTKLIATIVQRDSQ